MRSIYGTSKHKILVGKGCDDNSLYTCVLRVGTPILTLPNGDVRILSSSPSFPFPPFPPLLSLPSFPPLPQLSQDPRDKKATEGRNPRSS